ISLTARTSLIPSPPRPTLFPYTTLFRSSRHEEPHAHEDDVRHREALHRPPHELAAEIHQRSRCYVPHPDEERVDGLLRLVLHLRSEEHTSELQSRENLVCRLLLQIKNFA